MKKTNALVLGLSVLSLGMLSSCRSKSNEAPTPPTSEYLQVKQETNFDETGTIPEKQAIYTYDASGKTVKEQFLTYNTGFQRFEHSSYLTHSYNGSGLVTETLSYVNASGGSPIPPVYRIDRKFKYTYTGEQLTKEERYNFDIQTNQLVLQSETIYTWENGKKKKSVEYVYENGRRREYANVIYRYENGFEIQDHHNGREDYPSFSHGYRYDANGRVVEERTKNFSPILDGNNQRTGLREVKNYVANKEYNSLGLVTFEKSIETQYNVSGQVESVTKQETTYIYSGHDNHGYPTKLEVKLKEGDNAAKTVSQSKFENTYARR